MGAEAVDAGPPITQSEAITIKFDEMIKAAVSGLDASMNNAMSLAITKAYSRLFPGFEFFNAALQPGRQYHYIAKPTRWEECIGLGVLVDQPDWWRWLGDKFDTYVIDTYDTNAFAMSVKMSDVTGGHRYAVLIKPGAIDRIKQRLSASGIDEIVARFVFAFINKHDNV